MKNGLIYGLMAGLLYMVWVVIGDKIAPELVYGSMSSVAIFCLVIIMFMVLACQKEKKQLNGSILFGEAFFVCILTYAVSSLVYALGFKIFIESSPAAYETFIEVSKASTSDMLSKFGAPEDEIFDAVENIESAMKEVLTWKMTLINYFGSLVLPGLPIALITAAIISKLSKNRATV